MSGEKNYRGEVVPAIGIIPSSEIDGECAQVGHSSDEEKGGYEQ